MSSFKEEFNKKKKELSEEVEETRDSIGKVAQSGVRKTKLFFRRLFTVAAVGLVVAGLLYMVWCNWTYSEGTRTGVLIKISE